MQIAFFAVSKITEEERNTSVWAKKTCDHLFGHGGRGIPGFMIGRQLYVVSYFFVAAQATSMYIKDGESNVLGVPDGVQNFFDTGLLGAFMYVFFVSYRVINFAVVDRLSHGGLVFVSFLHSATNIACIAWQLVASAFPLAFLSTPVTFVLLRIYLALEATGICNGAWVIAAVHKKSAGFQKDEVYRIWRKLIDEASTADEKAAHESYLNQELVSLKKIDREQGEVASRRATAAVKDVEEGTDGEISERE